MRMLAEVSFFITIRAFDRREYGQTDGRIFGPWIIQPCIVCCVVKKKKKTNAWSTSKKNKNKNMNKNKCKDKNNKITKNNKKKMKMFTQKQKEKNEKKKSHDFYSFPSIQSLAAEAPKRWAVKTTSPSLSPFLPFLSLLPLPSFPLLSLSCLFPFLRSRPP